MILDPIAATYNNSNPTPPRTATNSSSTSSMSGGGGGMGRIAGERRISDSWVAQVRGGTHVDPCLVLTHWSAVPGLVFKAATNSLGQAWLSSLLLYSYNETSHSSSSESSSSPPPPPLDVRAVTWIPLDFRNKQTVQDVLSDVPHVHTFGAIQMGALTGAVESSISTSLGQATDNKFYLTYSLVDDPQPEQDESSSSNTNTTTTTTKGGPPLQVTVQKTNTSSSLALSQVFAFDRFQFNPFEDRANYVRNTVGWTIRLEKIVTPGPVSTSTTTTSTTEPKGGGSLDTESSSSSSSETRVAVGAAWQVNRSVALKAVVQPQQQQLDVALLLKRWKQPRVTCSLLARHNWQHHQTSFLGFGVELETGIQADSSNNNSNSSPNTSGFYAMEHSEGNAFPAPRPGEVPETKVVQNQQ